MEEIRDYYKNTREFIDKYNEIMYEIQNGKCEITDEEEEFLDNLSLYLAHALLKDHGPSGIPRMQLGEMCKFIEIALK